jgi:hypothetical protein
VRYRDVPRPAALKARPPKPLVPEAPETAQVRRLKKALILARQENERLGGKAVAQLSSENARLRTVIEDQNQKIERALRTLNFAVNETDVSDDEWRDMLARAIQFLRGPADVE